MSSTPSVPAGPSSSVRDRVAAAVSAVSPGGWIHRRVRQAQTDQLRSTLLAPPIVTDDAALARLVASSSSSGASIAPVSERCLELIANDSTPDYLAAHLQRMGNPDKYPLYDSRSHPDGYICLSIAENKTVWRLLEPWLSDRRGIGVRDTCYNNMSGTLDCRQSFATFFSRYIAGRPISPDRILLTAGANVALDSLFWTIANAGEYCLLATPYYSAFKVDLGIKAGVLIHEVPSRVEDGFAFDLDAYKVALSEARAQGRVVRAVLLCNPGNPTGSVLTRDQLRALAEWVRSEEGLHLVVDEVYALSTYEHLLDDDVKEPAALAAAAAAAASGQPAPNTNFVSITNVLSTPELMGDRVHVVYAISKDFGLSGFRCGLVHTENKRVLAAYGQLSQFNGISTDVQHFMHSLLSDDDTLVRFLTSMRRGLAEVVSSLMREFRTVGVPFARPQAALFLWIDLRAWLPEPTRAGEQALYRAILDECNVNLTPGTTFHSPTPGFFRFCHSAETNDVVLVAARRICAFLKKRGGATQH